MPKESSRKERKEQEGSPRGPKRRPLPKGQLGPDSRTRAPIRLRSPQLSTPHKQTQPQDLAFYRFQPIGIFKSQEVPDSQLKTWDRLCKEEADIAFRAYPRNSFDEMIQLTEEGKLWSYPIDNEAGLYDKFVYYYYHKHRFDKELIFSNNPQDWMKRPKSPSTSMFFLMICLMTYQTLNRLKISWRQ